MAVVYTLIVPCYDVEMKEEKFYMKSNLRERLFALDSAPYASISAFVSFICL
jgi:hypothetical protein